MNGIRIAGLLLPVIHLGFSLVIALLILAHRLRVEKYLIPAVFFIPVWGTAAVITTHILTVGKQRRLELEVEKLKVQDEVFKLDISYNEPERNNIVPLEDALLLNDRKIRHSLMLDVLDEVYQTTEVEPESDKKGAVSLEEALLINSNKLRRSMMLDVLMEDSNEYVGILDEARLNDDVDVVHFATTAMSEISKESDLKIQEFEKEIREDPENLQLLRNYADFLSHYLSHGLAQGQMRRVRLVQYEKVLKTIVEKDNRPAYSVQLVNTQLELGDTANARETLALMQSRWPEREETILTAIRIAAAAKDKQAIQTVRETLTLGEAVLSENGRETALFWMNGGNVSDEG